MDNDSKKEFERILKITARNARILYDKGEYTKKQLEAVKDSIFFQASFICDVIGWSRFCDEIETILCL